MPDLTIVFPPATRDDPKKPLPMPFVAAGLVPNTIDGTPVDTVWMFLQRYRGANNDELDDTQTLFKVDNIRPHTDAHNPCKHDRLAWFIFANYEEDHPLRARVTFRAYEHSDDDYTGREYERPYICQYTPINLWLKKNDPPFIPTIDWPDTDGYTVTGDELGLFLTFGASNYPLTRIDITAADPAGGTMGTTDCQWNDSDEFWWGTFQPGALAGYANRQINVASSQGARAPRPIVVS